MYGNIFFQLPQNDTTKIGRNLKIADDLNRNKLDPRYEGPFEIINRCSDVIYVLNVAGNEVTSHIENMKPLNTRTGYRGYTIIDDESIESDNE